MRRMMMITPHYLCSALVVKREDVVSSPRLALSHEEVPMTVEPSMLDKVGSPHTWYGPMKPWVRGQEVIRFIIGVLCESKTQRACGDKHTHKTESLQTSEQSITMQINFNYLFSFQMMYKSPFQKMYPYDWFCGPGSQMSSVLSYFRLFELI